MPIGAGAVDNKDRRGKLQVFPECFDALSAVFLEIRFPW
jgi:hypothetical protein